MKKLFSTGLLVASALACLLASPAGAYNDSRFPGASASLAVNRGIAKANQVGMGGGRAGSVGKPCEAGNLDIGSVEDGARGPRTQTIVIKGDVTNVNKGRGNLLCR